MNERVKEVRKALGLTQDKFCIPLGIKKNSLSQIENGVNNLSEQMLKSICRAYNVNEEWLRNGTGEMFVELSKEEEIAAFIGDALSGTDETFKKSVIYGLAQMDEQGWKMLRKVLNDISTANAKFEEEKQHKGSETEEQEEQE